MKFKKRLIILILTLFLFSIASVCASEANDTIMASEDEAQIELAQDVDGINLENGEDIITIGDLNDDELKVQVSDSLNEGSGIDDSKLEMSDNGKLSRRTVPVLGYTFEDIRDAIDYARHGDTVYLKAGTYTNNGLTYINVEKNISIVGEMGSTILDGQNESPMFYFYECNVTIRNIDFINAHNYETGYGGAIEANHASCAVFNCNFMNGMAKMDGGVIYINRGGLVVSNCTFVNNTCAKMKGGAIYIYSSSNVSISNSLFANNRAGSKGGAVILEDTTGTVSNCIFIDNSVADDGGAICFEDYSDGFVYGCSFVNNYADRGSAIFFDEGSGLVSICTFVNNTGFDGSAIYNWEGNSFADTCIFKTVSDTYGGGVTILTPTLMWDDSKSVYGFGEKFTFNLSTNRGIPVEDGNISISVYDRNNGSWVGNYSCLSGEGWTLDLPAGSYIAVFSTEYEEFTPVNASIKIKMPTQLVAENLITTYDDNKELVVTLRDICKNPIADANVTVEGLNGVIVNTTDDNGEIRISTKGLAVNEYDVKISFGDNDTYFGCSASVKVCIQEPVQIISAPLTTVYGSHKPLVASLKDSKGNPIKNEAIYITIGGVTYPCKSDNNGNAELFFKLNPDAYDAAITYDGNVKYTKTIQVVKVTVKKATPKVTAKKKTFKAKAKTKKYSVILKDNNNKPMVNVKLTLKIKNKVFSAKTDKSGKATFKIKKLTKKGKYKAVIKYKGNGCYKAVSKKVQIKLK